MRSLAFTRARVRGGAGGPARPDRVPPVRPTSPTGPSVPDGQICRDYVQDRVMRGFLASSIGVTCAAALALPLALARGRGRPAAGRPAARPVRRRHRRVPGTHPVAARSAAASDRATGALAGPAAEQGLPRRDVQPFSLVGVVWDDAGRRTARPRPGPHPRRRHRQLVRLAGPGDPQRRPRRRPRHAPSAPRAASAAPPPRCGSATPTASRSASGPERRPGPARRPAGPAPRTRRPGQARAAPRAPATPGHSTPSRSRPARRSPGADDARPADGDSAARAPAVAPRPTAADARSVRRTEPAPASARRRPRSRRSRRSTSAGARRGAAADASAAAAKPYIGPRPRIVTRKGWGADEKLRESGFVYTKTVKAAFVHHTATGNNYTLRPGALRPARYLPLPRQEQRLARHRLQLRRRQVRKHLRRPRRGRGQGRHRRAHPRLQHQQHGHRRPRHLQPKPAGRRRQRRRQAHRLEARPLRRAIRSGKTHLMSGGGNKYKKGKKVKLNVISGHRDGFATECPGARLYEKLGTARTQRGQAPGPLTAGRVRPAPEPGVCIHWPPTTDRRSAYTGQPEDSTAGPSRKQRRQGDRSDPPGRRQGHPAAPAHGAHAQADGPGGRRPLPHAPAGARPGRRRRAHRARHVLPGRGLRAVLR